MNLSKIYKICCIVERPSLENLVPFIMNSAWRQQNIPWNISHIVVNISFLICFEPLFNVFSSYCNIFRFNARNKNKTTVLKAARFFNSAWNLSMTTFCFWPYSTLYIFYVVFKSYQVAEDRRHLELTPVRWILMCECLSRTKNFQFRPQVSKLVPLSQNPPEPCSKCWFSSARLRMLCYLNGFHQPPVVFAQFSGILLLGQ